MQTFLAPGFVLQRADGSNSRKTEFLANLPNVESVSISKLAATEANGTLVAHYDAETTGLSSTGKRFTPGPAPRLAVFSWNGKHWQLAAYANFNTLNG